MAACSRIYIDMGTNDGLKLRQLYTPEKNKYGQLMFADFDAATGKRERSDICALAFEPVPRNVESVTKRASELRASSRAPSQLFIFSAAVGSSRRRGVGRPCCFRRVWARLARSRLRRGAWLSASASLCSGRRRRRCSCSDYPNHIICSRRASIYLSLYLSIYLANFLWRSWRR